MVRYRCTSTHRKLYSPCIPSVCISSQVSHLVRTVFHSTHPHGLRPHLGMQHMQLASANTTGRVRRMSSSLMFLLTDASYVKMGTCYTRCLWASGGLRPRARVATSSISSTVRIRACISKVTECDGFNVWIKCITVNLLPLLPDGLFAMHALCIHYPE